MPEEFKPDTAFSDAAAAAANPPQEGQQPAPQPQPSADQAAQAAPAPQPTPQPTVNPLFERAKSLGLEGFKTESELAAALLEQVQNLRPYASYGQQLLPHSERIQKLLAEADAPPAADPNGEWTPDKYFGEKWQAPKWESTYDFAIQQGIVVKDPETGGFVPAPGKEQLAMPILPGLNAAVTAKAQQVRDLFEGNPYEKFFNVLREPFQREWKKDIQELIQQQIAEQQTEQAVTRIEKEISPKALTIDPVTRQQVVTPWGQKYFAISESLAAIGDPQKIHELTMQMIGDGAAPATPANPAAASAARQQSFIDDARARAMHAPSAGGYVAQGPHDPIHVQQAELDNMFSTELARAQNLQPA